VQLSKHCNRYVSQLCPAASAAATTAAAAAAVSAVSHRVPLMTSHASPVAHAVSGQGMLAWRTWSPLASAQCGSSTPCCRTTQHPAAAAAVRQCRCRGAWRVWVCGCVGTSPRGCSTCSPMCSLTQTLPYRRAWTTTGGGQVPQAGTGGGIGGINVRRGCVLTQVGLKECVCSWGGQLAGRRLVMGGGGRAGRREVVS
jgi:hypothetical protein